VADRDTLSPLDIYALSEDLLGLSEAATSLYGSYLTLLSGIDFDSLIDIGCGGGDFLETLEREFGGRRYLGIDRSRLMVERARESGVNARCMELSELEDRYDVATAVFDVVNYIPPSEIGDFMKDVARILEPGGYFIFDINTRYGFEEIATGSFSAEDERRFVSVDGDFEDGLYTSRFTLFTASEEEEGCYLKRSGTIEQYLHTLEGLSTDLFTTVSQIDISLYGDEADETLLIFSRNAA